MIHEENEVESVNELQVARERTQAVKIEWIVEAGAKLLRGCPACHAPHPLARRPVPENVLFCPDCGELVEEPVDIDVTGVQLGAGVQGGSGAGQL